MSEPKVMKKYCSGCPYDYGSEATEQAYNLGCLPSVGEISKMCGDDKTWACHSAKSCICKGFAENKEVLNKPLLTVKGIHS